MFDRRVQTSRAEAHVRSRSRLSGPLALVVAAYALLSVAWVFGNPPFASPDEAAHYVRAVGVSDGVLVGTPAQDPNPVLTPKQRAWSTQAARTVDVPGGLAPAGNAPCMSGQPQRSAACTAGESGPNDASRQITSVGTYQPLPYLLPAAVLRAADTAGGADRLARLATVAVWLALLAGALLALWDRRRGLVSLVGVLLALTPQAVFVGATLNGSSLEIVASCAFFAALLRVVRTGEEPVPRAVWALAGAAGVVLALSRTTGPVWVLVALGVAALLAGRSGLAAVWTAERRRVVLLGVALAVAIVANRAWEAGFGPDVTTSLLPPLEAWKAGRREYAGAAHELVGDFGYLDTALSPWLIALWAALAAALVTAAIRLGSARGRIALLVTLALAALLPMYLFAAVTRFTGFGLQGRHVLPLVVLVPLLAGEVVTRARVRLPAAPVLAAVVAAVQVLAWWTNARRYAVGEGGSWWFPGRADWAPPSGWVPWAAMVIAAGACLAAAGAAEWRARRRAVSP